MITQKQKSKKHLILFAGLMLSAIFVSACYTDYGLAINEYDITTTIYDKDINFQNWKTYAITDSIEYVVKEGDTPDRTYEAQILGKIKAEMNAYGWTEVSIDTTEPDVGILVTVSEVDNYTYWGYYPGWGYGPGWGWGYPPYYGGGVTYAYSSGTIFTNMVDYAKIDSTDKILPTVWYSGINGVTNDSRQNIITRINLNFEQAFKQSPYLKLNQ